MIWETVGGSILGAFLQVLFGMMASRQFLDFFREPQFNIDLLKQLKITLLTVNAVLTDAEEKQITNPSVKEWVDELKDAVYDAEDLLDSITTEAMRCKLEAGSQSDTNQVQAFNSSLRNIVDRLKPLAEQKDFLSLKEAHSGKPLPRLPTTSLVDESEVFGRNKEKDYIIDQFLLSNSANENDVPVVTLVGMGGIGKTTLAQLLYNDKKVVGYFGLRAWVYVSEEFDVFKVTKTIYESITGKDCKTRDLDVLQVRLKKILMRKTFLLVLDDIWNENFIEWDVLRMPFKAGDCRSRIIVTTRSQSVSSIMRAVRSHSLPSLSHEDCWSIFAAHALKRGNTHRDPTLEAIGKKIVRKCQGLPLAVKVLGGLLHSKVEEEEWDHVLHSKMWDLPHDKSNILPALRLSYYHLPSHLKRCFAYCSIYPKGYQIEMGSLIRLWMAEGLVLQPKNKKRVEDVGEDYFHELLSRSFFQESSSGKSSFVMHDLVAELAQHVAGEFCFKVEDGNSIGTSEKARHLSYIPDPYEPPYKFDALYGVQHLRTFLAMKSSDSRNSNFLSSSIFDNLLPALSYLRVLSLSPYRQISKLPNSVGNLKHLRYLDLSLTKITCLPETASSLYNLETLLLSSCRLLTKLPHNMHKLINLRYLDISGTSLEEMPLQFGSLRSLQFLSTFVVSVHGGSRISELKRLCELRGTLSILNLQNVDEGDDASEADLKNKKYLNELVFQWDASPHNSQSQTDVLEKLQPHENLKKLTIKNFGGMEFPGWLQDDSLSKVVYLCLSDCQNFSSLPPLGQLYSLKELHVANMEGIKRVGREFFGSGSSSIKPFSSLETLKFRNMPNLEDWLFSDVGEGEFPSLQELHVEQCPKLTGNLPIHLHSLKSLKIHKCRELKLLSDDAMHNDVSVRHLLIKSSCDSLWSFPLSRFTKLENVQIHDCRNLKSLGIPEELGEDLRFLQNVNISYCPKLENFPGGLTASSLTSLSVSNCKKLKSMPEQMHIFLKSLKVLELLDCPELMSFPEGGLPSSLQSLIINSCDNLTPRIEWALCSMKSLTYFEIEGGCSTMELFPEEGLLPATLTELHISGLQNLKSLDLQNLTSLEILAISCCDRLNCISEVKLPASISSLIINECCLLAPRCQEGTGRDWDKICHIPERHIS